jgi:hypothetical protein
MERVHVFISTARFSSFAEMRSFIDPAYTADGNCVPSHFMREVGLTDFEPGCIEAIREERPTALAELLADASYGDQWVPQLDGRRIADSAICVFAPNRLRHPHRSSLEYIGAFDYVAR